MKLIHINNKNKKEIKQYQLFREQLYQNDNYYCYTDSFIFDMLLRQTTIFARSCEIDPVMVQSDSNESLCEAMLIYNPKDDFIQVSFFEALKDVQEAVDLLINEAKYFAIKNNAKKIIIGLNGHLSYSVGLTATIQEPNSFGSSYSKPYYCDYFQNYQVHKCFSYSNTLSHAVEKTRVIASKEFALSIRPINFRNFKEDMEIFKNLCDQTIGTTFLYSPTDSLHFYELMKDMTFFLRKENILFVYDKEKPVGFVFWNPDYNQALPKGKKLSLLEIALFYTMNKKKITRVTLNSAGVLEEYQGFATSLIAKAIHLYLKTKHYKNIDTFEGSFVWENNRKAHLLNRHVIGSIDREYRVYEIDL